MSTPQLPRPTASYIKNLRDREAEKAAEKAAASLAYASPCSIQPVDDQSSVRVQQHIFACFQRKAESVEERMFELSTYELAAPPLKKLPGSHLEHPPDGDVNSNLKAGGGRRDVDAELQEKHGYTTTSLPLPKSGLLGTRLCAPADGVTVLLHPKERKSEVAVLWVPGFGGRLPAHRAACEISACSARAHHPSNPPPPPRPRSPSLSPSHTNGASSAARPVC